MKRIHEESDEEQRLQSIVRVLDSTDAILVFGFEELDTMLRAFRFHPRRLLRLMQGSKAVNEAVERALVYNVRFWFECCVASFPDVVIMLDVRHRLSDFNRLTYSLIGNDPRQHQHLFLTPDHNSSPWHFYATVAEAAANSGAQEFDLAICHSFATANDSNEEVDSEFTDPERWRRKYDAKRMALYFALYHPYALPPAEYCFVSRVKAQALLFELLALMTSEKARAYVTFTTDRSYTIYPGDYGGCVSSLSGVEFWRKSYEDDHDGPMKVFDLERLAHDVTDYVTLALADAEDNYWNGLSLAVVPQALGLFRRVRYAQLLHCEDEEWTEWVYRAAGDGVILDFNGVTDLSYAEYGAALQQERTALNNLYGTSDPLYWDVLLLRQGSNIAGDDLYVVVPDDMFMGQPDRSGYWKRVVVTQLQWVDQYAPEHHPIHKAMTSGIPDVALACHACGANDSRTLSVQSNAPFGVYCSGECPSTH